MESVAFIRRLVQKEMSLVPSVRPRKIILGVVAKEVQLLCTHYFQWDYIWADSLGFLAGCPS